jgi:hypothetical protein
MRHTEKSSEKLQVVQVAFVPISPLIDALNALPPTICDLVSPLSGAESGHLYLPDVNVQTEDFLAEAR